MQTRPLFRSSSSHAGDKSHRISTRNRKSTQSFKIECPVIESCQPVPSHPPSFEQNSVLCYPSSILTGSHRATSDGTTSMLLKVFVTTAMASSKSIRFFHCHLPDCENHMISSLLPPRQPSTALLAQIWQADGTLWMQCPA